MLLLLGAPGRKDGSERRLGGVLLEAEGCEQPQLQLRSALLGSCKYPPEEMVGTEVGDADLCSGSKSGLQSCRFLYTSGLLVGIHGCGHLAEGGSTGKNGSWLALVVSASRAKGEEVSTSCPSWDVSFCY